MDAASVVMADSEHGAATIVVTARTLEVIA